MPILEPPCVTTVQAVEGQQRGQGMVACRAQAGLDQERAQLVAVEAEGAGLVVDLRTADVGGWVALDQGPGGRCTSSWAGWRGAGRFSSQATSTVGRRVPVRRFRGAITERSCWCRSRAAPALDLSTLLASIRRALSSIPTPTTRHLVPTPGHPHARVQGGSPASGGGPERPSGRTASDWARRGEREAGTIRRSRRPSVGPGGPIELLRRCPRCLRRLAGGRSVRRLLAPLDRRGGGRGRGGHAHAGSPARKRAVANAKATQRTLNALAEAVDTSWPPTRRPANRSNSSGRPMAWRSERASLTDRQGGPSGSADAPRPLVVRRSSP